jgi:predicted TIM-barrel fold metal-dependent hydrolase
VAEFLRKSAAATCIKHDTSSKRNPGCLHGSGNRFIIWLRGQVAATPVEQARKLYFDKLVFDAPTLCHLVDVFGETQLMLGTDYPFNFHDRAPVASVEAAGFEALIREKLIHRNAKRFLGMTPRKDR